MRQAFIIGAIFLFIVINILGNIADQQSLLAQADSHTGYTQHETLEELRKPDITDTSSGTFIGKMWSYIQLFGKTLTLWHPALWQGAFLYVYIGIFLPIGISFWVVIAFAIRGIGSS